MSDLDHGQLLDAIDGLYAWDGGSLDSGIHDPVLRGRVIAQLREMPAADREAVVMELYGQPPYGIEDQSECREWMAELIA